MINALSFSLVVPMGALLFAGWLVSWVMKKDQGTEDMKKVARAIQEGAQAFLSRQYRTIAMIGVVVAAVMLIGYTMMGNSSLGWHTSISFLLGALFSAISGIIGMWVAVHTNVRSAAGARRGFIEAMTIALRGGAISGVTIVSLSLIGIAGLFLAYRWLGFEAQEIPHLIVGYGFGASLVALFAQLGGGIYTKAADVGADLVGKIEAGIPEDDPRNPAVIADLVGDNVGDCAGRGADLFESSAAENIGAMLLGAALFPVFGLSGILYPLVLGATGLVASMIGVLAARAKESDDPMAVLNRGYYVATALAAIGFFFVTKYMLGNTMFFWAGLVGIVTSVIFLFITQYYTDAKYRPVQEIAKASETGHGTNIISGYAVGLESTGLTVATIAIALYVAYQIGVASGVAGGGLYGTAVATMGMLVTAAYVLAMDTFGPIADNGGGIAEMAGEGGAMRDVMDKLDAAGNTTKALTKGYAIGSAALAAFLLFSAYLEEVNLTVVDMAKVEVFIGALIGATLVFVFSSLAIRAVSRAAYSIINEVRRQFKERPGIMKGTEKPDYSRAVDITTQGALKEMVLPGVMAVVVPVAVGLLLGAEAEAGLIMVGTITGILMATLMNNAGGAWDNAKKWIETGKLGGKKSPAHQAAVTGDTVGDPFKDTAGPSLHVLIKLLATLTLALAPLFAR